jgi:hypothetical protein
VIIIFTFLVLATFSPISAKVTINEIHPNPEEGSEWVELLLINEDFTEEEAELTISNYSLEDNYHQIYLFSDEEFSLIEEEYLLTVEVAGLNNGEDQVILKNSDSETIDQFSYSQTEKGLSWSFDQNSKSFQLSKPSKNQSNPEITTSPSPSPTTTIVPSTISPQPSSSPNPSPSLKPQENNSQINTTPPIVHYHNYNPRKIKLKTEENPFLNRETRMVFLQEQEEKSIVINAIMGGSLISVSAYFLLYVRTKNKKT